MSARGEAGLVRKSLQTIATGECDQRAMRPTRRNDKTKPNGKVQQFQRRQTDARCRAERLNKTNLEKPTISIAMVPKHRLTRRGLAPGPPGDQKPPHHAHDQVIVRQCCTSMM